MMYDVWRLMADIHSAWILQNEISQGDWGDLDGRRWKLVFDLWRAKNLIRAKLSHSQNGFLGFSSDARCFLGFCLNDFPWFPCFLCEFIKNNQLVHLSTCQPKFLISLTSLIIRFICSVTRRVTIWVKGIAATYKVVLTAKLCHER